jgi:hypothetical protein
LQAWTAPQPQQTPYKTEGFDKQGHFYALSTANSSPIYVILTKRAMLRIRKSRSSHSFKVIYQHCKNDFFYQQC